MAVCSVCSSLEETELLRIRSMYLDEGSASEIISIEFGVPYDEMLEHLTGCLNVVEKSRFQILCELIEDLSENLAIAKTAYQSDPEQADMASAYNGFANTLRSTIESAQGLVKPEETVGELIDMVLNPFVRLAVISVTEEISKLKTELVSQGANEEHVLRASKARLKAIAGHLSRATNEAVNNMNTYYGVTVNYRAQQFEKQLKAAAAASEDSQH